MAFNFHSLFQFFSHEISNRMPVFLRIHSRVSVCEPLCFEDLPFFTLHGGFLQITLFVTKLLASFFLGLKVQGSLEVCVTSHFLFINPLWRIFNINNETSMKVYLHIVWLFLALTVLFLVTFQRNLAKIFRRDSSSYICMGKVSFIAFAFFKLWHNF